MGQNKKSRNGKKRVGRLTCTPMMPETHRHVAMLLYAAVNTLIEYPTIDAYNAMSINLMTFGRAFGKCDEIEQLKQAMLDIYARYERVGKIGVSASEAIILHAGASFIDSMMPTVSLEMWTLADSMTVEQANKAAYRPIKRPAPAEVG